MYQIVDPLDGAVYEVRVRARSDAGFGLWAGETKIMVPAAPVLAEPERYGMDVTFRWAAVVGADGYMVYGAFGPGVTEESTSVETTELEYTRTLNSGQTLYVRVAAFNDGGVGELSEEMSMQVPIT